MEKHKSEHIRWLRAAVLGANDGIVSTASLIVGVAAAKAESHSIWVAATAGLVAGAMSMACGEYISVSSQSDIEEADLARERHELATDIDFEREELAQIYVSRGLKVELARQVSEQLMAHDAVGAHARDELGIYEILRAKPIQAALASGVSFSLGGALPLLVVASAPSSHLIELVAGSSLLGLVALGAMAAKIGGANVWKGAVRVVFWGTLAMLITAGIGSRFQT